MSSNRPMIVTGSTGRIGRLLRAVWNQTPPQGVRPVWQTRQTPTDADQIQWDILHEPPPVDLPRGAIFLHLAGSTSRQAEGLAEHAPLARAAAAAAIETAAIHVLHASSAAVYGLSAADHDEDEPLAPLSPYGLAKAEAERALTEPAIVPVTLLRIGNIAGADALLGNPAAELVLDPVGGASSGPVRSYIGPRMLATVLGSIACRVAAGDRLPPIINLAQGPAVAMADLAEAAARNWRWGPENPQAIPRVGLSIRRLSRICPDLPPATAAGLVADLASLKGVWP